MSHFQYLKPYMRPIPFLHILSIHIEILFVLMFAHLPQPNSRNDYNSGWLASSSMDKQLLQTRLDKVSTNEISKKKERESKRHAITNAQDERRWVGLQPQSPRAH